MNTNKWFLLYGLVVGFVDIILGLILLLTGFYRGEGPWLVIFGVGWLVVVTVIWLGGRWLKNKGLTFVTWKGNVLNLDVKLFGVTICTVKFVFKYPITVVRREAVYEVNEISSL